MSNFEGEPNQVLPYFVVLHDGRQAEVSETDRAAVATMFNTLVDGLLKDHTEDVKYFKYLCESSLALQTQISQDMQWFIRIVHNTDPTTEVPKSIALQRRVNSRDRELLTYGLGSDGVVRRLDSGDIIYA